jgi:hypothetical protein
VFLNVSTQAPSEHPAKERFKVSDQSFTAEQVESTPSGEASPVQLDPNAVYVVPGFEAPLKGEQIKGGILMQADYTRKTQQLADERRQLEAVYNQSAEALQVMQLLAEDFDEGVKVLAPIFKGESAQMSTPEPEVQTPAYDPEIYGRVIAAEERAAQLEAQLYGFMANAQLTGEMKGLEERDPRFREDVNLRAAVTRVAAEKRLPFEDAYNLVTRADLERRIADLEAEKKAIEMRRYIPTLGGQSRPAAEAPVDSEDLFKQAFLDSLREQGLLK